VVFLALTDPYVFLYYTEARFGDGSAALGSFGIDFDPITGKLWDTVSGPDYGNEINLVEPGFNSGWNTVKGLWIRKNASLGNFVLSTGHNLDLTDLGGRGSIANPNLPVAILSVLPSQFFSSLTNMETSITITFLWALVIMEIYIISD
jgi:hypothetical protein